MPRAIIIAGPNGAGKTTFAWEFLKNEGACRQFVNADLIAAGISPFAPQSADIAAGRATIRRIEELVTLREDFAIETTLSGIWLANQVRSWKVAGYAVFLYYVQLDSADLAVERVRRRVERGGHSIPEAVIRRRFDRSCILLEDEFKDLVDGWAIYNNSGFTPFLVDSSERSS